MDNPSAILLARSGDIVRRASERLDGNAPSEALEASLGSICRFIDENESMPPAVIRGLGTDEFAARRALYCLAWTALDSLREDPGRVDFDRASGMVFKAIRGAIGLELLSSSSQREWRALLGGDTHGGQTPADALARAAGSFADLVCVVSGTGQVLWMNDSGLALLDYDAVALRQGITVFDIVDPQSIGGIVESLSSGALPVSHPIEANFYTSRLAPLPVRLYCERVELKDQPAVNLLAGRPIEEGGGRGARAVLASILKHMPIGIMLTDVRGRIVEANAQACTTVGANAATGLVGRPFLDLFAEDLEAPRNALAAALNRGDDVRMHFSGSTVFGEDLNCDMAMAPLRDANAQIEGVEIFLVDVSEQTALQRSLVQAEKLSALGEIVAGLAHELNNPLTGILGYAQLLMGSGLDEKTRGRLEQISLEAQRCRTIVQGLLGFARHYESAKLPGDVNALVSEVLSLRAYQMGVDKIETATSLGEHIPLVEIDRQEIQRVFLNIINNAHYALCQVNDRPRRFAVAMSTRGGEVSISFEDNGPGMPPETQSRVFDPFFTTKDIGEGIGMGLSIAYGVVRDHGGRILVESKLNHGTTFTVVLPAAANIAGA